MGQSYNEEGDIHQKLMNTPYLKWFLRVNSFINVQELVQKSMVAGSIMGIKLTTNEFLAMTQFKSTSIY